MRHNLLNKNVTTKLHGIAILMMIYHHIFLSGNMSFVDKPKSLLFYLNFLNMGLADNFQQTFAWFCRICVAIFAFTSGYGMYVQYEKKVGTSLNLKQMYNYAFKRILNFFKKYAIMYIIFVGLEIYTHTLIVEDYPISEFILSFLGLSYEFNFTWWYVSQYYLLILLSPIFYVILNKFELKHYLYVLGIFVLGLIISLLTNNTIVYLQFFTKNIQTQVMMFLIVFMEGMFIAHFNLIDIMSKKLNVVTSILIVLLVFVARVNLVRAASDSLFDLVLITPFILALTNLFSYSEKENTVLSFLGKHSTYMWFVHAYYYAYMFFILIIPCDQSIFVYIQTVIYSLVSAILLTKIEALLNGIYAKIRV